MLTQRQLQLLKFIQNYAREHGVSPSFEEMRGALKLRSKSGIHRLISGLEERGYIRRLAYRARALEVVRPFTDGPVGAELDTTPFEPPSNVVRGAFRRKPEIAASTTCSVLSRCTLKNALGCLSIMVPSAGIKSSLAN